MSSTLGTDVSLVFSQSPTVVSKPRRTVEPAPIHWPSAIVGLLLAIAMVVFVNSLAAGRKSGPIAREAPTAVGAQAAQIAPVAEPTPIPAPVVEPPAQPTVEHVRVANTRGSGVNMRSGPGERSMRIKTLNEGAALEIVGPDSRVDNVVWRNVRDNSGTSGWVAGTFLVSAPR